MKRLNYLIIVLIVLSSCQTVVDIERPDFSEDLVLNSILNPDSILVVELSESIDVLDDNEWIQIQNGSVMIYENEELLDELIHEKNGIYILPDYFPKLGASYRIVASSPNHDPVEATTLLPETAGTITSLSVDSVELVGEFGNSKEYRIEFEFDDPSGENYYEIVSYAIVVDNYYIEDDLIADTSYSRLYSLMPEDQSIEDFQEYDDSWVIDDKLFDGRTKKIRFTADGYEFSNRVLQLDFYLRHVTKDYYEYTRSKTLQEWIGGDPFAEPVPVFSNIENGFGIFAAYSQSKTSINLKK